MAYKKRVPAEVVCCGKCRMHGIRVPVLNHKRICPFRNCLCSQCDIVNSRRRRNREAFERSKKSAKSATATAFASLDLSDLFATTSNQWVGVKSEPRPSAMAAELNTLNNASSPTSSQTTPTAPAKERLSPTTASGTVFDLEYCNMLNNNLLNLLNCFELEMSLNLFLQHKNKLGA